MAERNATLATFYRGWEAYQEQLVGAVAPLTGEQLGMGASPDLRPIWVLVAHIVSARIWWFHYIMGEGSRDIAPMVHWDDDGQPQRTADELVAGLKASWALIETALERWTPADLDATFRHLRRTDEVYSRQWIIWHVIEHDIHHGGELSYSLGMHGLAGIDL